MTRKRHADISPEALMRMADVRIDTTRDYIEAKKILHQLVAAKDEKELNGESARYLELRRDGWDRARAFLETAI